LFLPATTARCHSGGCSGWEANEEAGSAAWRAEQLHGSGEGVDAVGEAGQPGAVRDGAFDAVLSHTQREELPAVFFEMPTTVAFACFTASAKASPTT
jgi:hypothetical protein